MSNPLTHALRHPFSRRFHRSKQVVARVPLRRRFLDLEALEDRLAPAVFNVNSLADILNPSSDTVTLRSAIQAANATPGSNTINLTIPGTYKITLAGAGDENNATGDFDIIPNPQSPAGSTLTIQNTSGQAVTVDGNHLDRVFDINPADAVAPANFTVVFGGTQASQGFTITGGQTPNGEFNVGGGGGIEDQGNVNLTVSNMVVTGNFAADDGGGIAMWDYPSASWTLTINHSTISNNSVNDAGGGIFSLGTGNIVITAGTVISGNFAYNQGGGIWLDSIGYDSANLTMNGTLVSNNQAFSVTGTAGGVGNDGNGNVVITNSTLSNNSAGTTGGGYGDAHGLGNLTLQGCVFSGNVATGNGGGVAAGGPSSSITNCEIDGNTSGGNGGGVSVTGSTLTVQSSTLANNTATGNGGGIELDTTGAGSITGSTITNTTITGNTTKNAGTTGGGIDAGASFTGGLKLLNDTINANSASSGGGVSWSALSGSTCSLENTIVAKNSAFTGPDASAKNAFSDVGGNLIGVSGSGGGNTGFTSATTQTGTVANPLNPLLGPLTNNGGPTIGGPGQTLTLKTEAPLAGSPAVGNGILTGAPATDERGSASITNGKINVGAVSLVPAAAASITGQTIQASEGQQFNGQVATLQNPSAQANDTFTATIDWGDKTAPTTGTVAGSNGSYSISGSHSYAEEGQYTITINAAKSTNATSPIATGTSTANIAEADLTVKAMPLTLTEGQSFSGTVATFSDPGAAANDTFTATISWGDNSSSTGTVTLGKGSYSVSGSHTYTDEGSFPVSISVTESGASQGSAGTSTATVAEGDQLAGKVPTTLTAAVGLSFSGTVATFADSYTASMAKDFTATIAWGDQSSSTGTVSGSNGAFSVAGIHTYGSAGSFSVSVTLTEKGPGSATATANGSIAVSALAPRPAIQDVLNTLPAMKHAATTSADTNKLGDVIDKLTPALWPSRWIDDYHLQPTLGQNVFDSVNSAVTELFGMYQDPTSRVPKNQLLGILNKLAQAMEQLASTAIADAIAKNGNQNQINNAKQELANGVNDLNAGNFGTVIGHFKNAWQDAEQAVSG